MDPRPAGAPRIERILFCTDFSDNAEFAFAYALNAAVARPGARLTLLHVVHAPEAQFWKTYIYEVAGVDDKAKRDIDRRVECYQQKVPPGVPFEAVFRVGQDHEEILKVATDLRADLIVLGRQGRSALQKVFFGNVTEKVVRHATCPVLVVPLSYQGAARAP